MKANLLFIVALVLSSTGAIAQDGICRPSASSTSSVPEGQLLVVCGDVNDLTRDETGRGIFRERVGLMAASTVVSTASLKYRRSDGREITIDAPVPAGTTIEAVRRLRGQALFSLFPAQFAPGDLANIDVNSARIENYGIDQHSSKFTPSRCTYISSEVRDVNLLRFLTSTSCTNAGSCLPSRIQICSVRIGCHDDPMYGNAEYGTVCKAVNGQCPSVDECIRDDAAMTRAEAQETERLRAAPASGAAAN